MNVEEALFVLDTVLQQKFLNNVQELVFRQAWIGKTYPEIAESSSYNAHYIKDVGYKLWKLLSKALEEKVTKSNFRSVLRRRYFAFQHACRASYPKKITSLKDIASGQEIGELQQTPVVNTVLAAPLYVNAKETIANPRRATGVGDGRGDKGDKEEGGDKGDKGEITVVSSLSPPCPPHPPIPRSPDPSCTRSNWGEVVEISPVYGRTEEPKTLKQWIVDACYRLMALLAMGELAKPLCRYAVQNRFRMSLIT